MKKIVMLLVPVLALVGGVAAGEMLRPVSKEGADTAAGPVEGGADGPEADTAAPTGGAADKAAEDKGDKPAGGDQAAAGGKAGDGAATGWFTFPAQFIVPLTRDGDLGEVMILSLSIETAEGELPAMEQQEHRLRDALLRELLIHANTGGFDGNFTAEARLAPLRERLLKAADASTDLTVGAVLIEDIARQEG